jgi:hypothetical protein
MVTTTFIRQALLVPLLAMLAPILIAFTLPGYSSLSQHISEVALIDHPIAAIQRSAAVAAGVSILLFGFGALCRSPKSLPYTGVAAAIFGISMISNGLFVMGSPLHGLYGLGLFMTLVPAFFAAEFRNAHGGDSTYKLSMAVAAFNMFYMWVMLSGFDPQPFRGLTQRIATIVIFGWYSLAAYAMLYGQRGLNTTTHESPSF